MVQEVVKREEVVKRDTEPCKIRYAVRVRYISYKPSRTQHDGGWIGQMTRLFFERPPYTPKMVPTQASGAQVIMHHAP